MTKPLVIAIDGASGSGKSSTARGVAGRLGLGYLDTGAMYRAVTVAYLDSGVDGTDPEAVTRAVVEADIEISIDPDDQWIRVNGRDVTGEIREQRTAANVSTVAVIPECRANLVARQRAIIEAAPEGIVAEGRDITTVVAPDATVRLLLTADPEVRMARRRLDLGGAVEAGALADQVLRRDADDSRLVNFTTAADGVIHLDCTYLTLEETIQTVLDLVAAA